MSAAPADRKASKLGGQEKSPYLSVHGEDWITSFDALFLGMHETLTPPLVAFLQSFPTDRGFCQLWIHRESPGIRLRHWEDRHEPSHALRNVGCQSLREIAEFDLNRCYRPLRSAPDLIRGWESLLASEHQLGFALDMIYPGGLADWYSVETGRNAPSTFREFVDRQTGMYRVAREIE